jgi:hypothetical protein
MTGKVVQETCKIRLTLPKSRFRPVKRYCHQRWLCPVESRSPRFQPLTATAELSIVPATSHILQARFLPLHLTLRFLCCHPTRNVMALLMANVSDRLQPIGRPLHMFPRDRLVVGCC